MALSKEDIIERQKTLLEDAKQVQTRISDIKNALQENENLLQALNGAMQQCNEFLKSFEDVNGDAGNGKKKPD